MQNLLNSLTIMARHAKFKITDTPSGWMVNVPCTLTESGKRERHYFKTRKLAADHASTIKERVKLNGQSATAIKPSLAEAATLAESILKPWGLSIVEAAQMVAVIREKETASRSLKSAADDWLLTCEGLRDRTVASYKSTIKKLKAGLGDKLMASITATELQKTISPLGSVGASARGQIRNARAFWRWAATKGWCEAEIFAGVEMPKANRDSDEIAILTPKECEVLLRTAEEHYPQAVASFALQLFAGIRAEELVRLEAGNITEDGIDLAASVTKKGRRRHITPSATLAAWLKAYPFKPCSNWKQTNNACRRLAGWAVESRLLSDPLEPTRGAWPQNALRHSHASYAIASGVPLESLLFEFGHTGSAAVLREHYVGKASKKQALAFFAVMPKGVEAPATIQPLEAPAA